jgi:hypothetical protein
MHAYIHSPIIYTMLDTPAVHRLLGALQRNDVDEAVEVLASTPKQDLVLNCDVHPFTALEMLVHMDPCGRSQVAMACLLLCVAPEMATRAVVVRALEYRNNDVALAALEAAPTLADFPVLMTALMEGSASVVHRVLDMAPGLMSASISASELEALALDEVASAWLLARLPPGKHVSLAWATLFMYPVRQQCAMSVLRRLAVDAPFELTALFADVVSPVIFVIENWDDDANAAEVVRACVARAPHLTRPGYARVERGQPWCPFRLALHHTLPKCAAALACANPSLARAGLAGILNEPDWFLSPGRNRCIEALCRTEGLDAAFMVSFVRRVFRPEARAWMCALVETHAPFADPHVWDMVPHDLEGLLPAVQAMLGRPSGCMQLGRAMERLTPPDRARASCVLGCLTRHPALPCLSRDVVCHIMARCFV